MSFYLDTSVIVSILTEEVNTGSADQWLLSHPDEPKLISWWVEVEWSAAISRKLNAGTLDRRTHAVATSAFIQLIAASFGVLSVKHNDFTSARDLASRAPGLRAGDALHLAIAASHDATIVTFDRRMHAAAQTLGLPSILP